MNEVSVVAAFFLLMGLLVARMVREHREQAPGKSRPSRVESADKICFRF
jgi:hypothetical protein